MLFKKLAVFVFVTSLVLIGGPLTKVSANHSWGSYHWERSSNPLVLGIGYNLSSEWMSHFNDAISDWNRSTVLSLSGVPGATSTRRCKADVGRVEVCNDFYGNTGWLGIAGISISGGHIVSSYVKLNDTYYSSPTYNTSDWRQFVMCQEIGHAFGLAHQDENFNNPNLGSCMDYTSNPSTNTEPNQHDYDQLQTIYSHLDGGGDSGGGGGGPPDCRGRGCKNGADVDVTDPREWGTVVERDEHGRPILYLRDLGNGKLHFTHIYPVPELQRGNHDH